MATEVGQAIIPVRPDLEGFTPAVKREADSALGGMKSWAKNMATVIGGAFVVQKGFEVVSGALDAARESIKVSAQTTAAIKSTGKAANVTADEIGDYAHELQLMSGVSDETIQSGANMLLTFTKIRNEVGAGNDIFDQATATLLDMSVATGQDMSSAAVQLGKALNDPIAGVSALARVGVQFTDVQKDQIRTLVEAGDVMGAQKIILAELNTQFGGSAKAAGEAMDPMERLSMKWGDMQEQLGLWLIPKIESLVTWLGQAADWYQRNSDVLNPLLILVGSLTAAVIAVTTAVKIYTAVQTALNVVLTANPIGLVIAAVAALVAGLVIAYQKSETFRTIVDGAFSGVATAAGFMKDMVLGHIQWMVDKFLGAAEWIVKGAASAFGWVPGLGGKLKDAARAIEEFRDDANRFLDGIRDKEVKINLRRVMVEDVKPGERPQRMPVHHSGGTFRAQSGGEGVALLRDKEVITTPETMDDVLAELQALRAVVSRLPADYVQRNRAA